MTVTRSRPTALAAGHAEGVLDDQYFINQFVDALRRGTVRAEIEALTAGQQALLRDWIDDRELWRQDVERLWPLTGGKAVEEELLRWRIASAAEAAADRAATGDGAEYVALLAALERCGGDRAAPDRAAPDHAAPNRAAAA